MDAQYSWHSDTSADESPLAIRVGDFIFSGGQMAIHPIEGFPKSVQPTPGYPWHGSSMERQLRYIYNNLSKTLEELGSSLRHVMKINSFHLNPLEIDMALRVRPEFFGDAPPPSTLLLVPELTARGPSVNLDVVAIAGNSSLQREPIYSGFQGPAQNQIYGQPIFLQAVRGGGLVFTRGKAGATDDRGAVPEVFGHPDFPYQDNQIRFQTEFALTSLQKVLEDAGISLRDVVKAEVYLGDMRHLASMNDVWERFFPNDPPARLVAPASIALPDMVVEIELIAVDPNGPYTKEVISTREAPTPLGPESQAIKAGPFLFLSGQMATDYVSGVPREARSDPGFPFHSSNIVRQVEYIYKNVATICKAAGVDPRNLLRRRALHLDLNDLTEGERVWKAKMDGRPHPRTILRLDGSLPVPDCSVLYDITGYTSS